MYFSINRFTGDGTTTQWEFNFSGGYIDQAHVKVLVIDPFGVETVPTFTWVGPNTISIVPAVASGSTLEVYRDTPKNLPLVDYTDGAIVSEKNLDTTAEQGVFIAAEVFDRFSDTKNLVVSAATSAVEAAEFAAVAVGTAARDASAAQVSASAAAVAAAASQVALTNIEAELDSLVGGDFSDFLRGANNLSDVDNATTARSNLGLGNVDNTPDIDKPVSTAQASAISSAVSGISKTSLGLGNVDNTSDVGKPVSTAQAAAIAVAAQDVIDTLTAAGGSNIVGFQQAGTGAAVRTAQDKLREVVSIKDFGAVGDNLTDDTLACKRAAAYLRAKGGGTLLVSDGTFRVWTTLPSPGEKLFDWSGCRGVTVIYSNAKIVAERPNTATGDTVTAIIHGLENVQRFTVINPCAEQVGSVVPASGGIVQFGVGMAGGANQSSGIKIINARQTGGLGGLIVYASGAPEYRAHTIEMDGYFEGVYYPQNFQGNGDNYRGRVTTRNCGRSYFPYNVSGHDVFVDSNNGTAFDDINISAYTNTAFRGETSGIKVRYRNWGSASLGNAVHFGFIQSDGVSRAAMIKDVSIDFDMNVGTYPGSYVSAKKYTNAGVADNTARGHSFINVTISGCVFGTAALNPVQMFNAENWTGEFVYGLRFRDLQLTSQTAGGQAWRIDGRGISRDGGGITFENVFTNVPITKTNMPQGVQNIRNVAESGSAIDGGVGNWTRSYLAHGLCLLTYIGGVAVPNGSSTTLTLPFADKRGANPHVVITSKGVLCKHTATALTPSTFSISHDHTVAVAFDVFVMMYV